MLKGFAIGALLCLFCVIVIVLAPRGQEKINNAKEICRAYGGAVLEKPYPQLAGVRLIPLEKGRVCGNVGFRLSLKKGIEAALSAE